jgi:hypothetical protein
LWGRNLFDLGLVSACGTDFRSLTSHWPGLGPAADRLLCCTTKKSARKRTPLSRPLRGFPLSGPVRRGLRKLALRAQTCAALFPPAEPSSRRARGERKCRLPTVSANRSFRRGSVHPESPFRPAEQRSSRRGSPARLSEPEGRVPRRPPAGSSAGESFAKRMTGVAGSPSLLTFLATQESQSAAGPRPGQRYAKHGKSKQRSPKP